MTDPSSLPPSGSLLPDATMHPRDVAALQLRLPTFWRNNPQLWFAQVEATFDLHHISSEISRFRHLLCNVSPEVAEEVADVIAAPLNDAPYQRLKQSILDRTTTSESARLRHLLTSEELGDRRPSQLLNSMRQLLRSSDVDSNGALFRELFLQRLPQSTRLVLAAAGDLTLDRLAQLADRVHDATSATVAALSSTPESSVVSRLESRIDQLAASIDALRTSPHDHRGAGGPVETTDAAARGTLASAFSAGAFVPAAKEKKNKEWRRVPGNGPGTRQLVLEACDMTDPSSLPPSGSLLPDATMHPRDVAALQLRLPTFWRNNPQLWFAQVEATFDLHHISSEISRFRHLLCNVSPEVAEEVADVIAAPLNDAPYQRLKQSILDRTTTSESARLRHLLTSEELGDRRPSQLLNSMRQLLRSSDVDSNGALFRELFLQRLPQSTRLVLAAAGDLTLDRLAQLADRVHDATSATVAALSSTPESSVVSRLESRIDQLAASIDALRTSPHDHRGTLNTDDVWSGLVDSNFVTATDTFQEFVDAGESELSVCEEASTDDAIVAAVRGSAEVATDDESDGEDDVDPTPEPDFPCKDALEYLAKVKTYCAKNSLSEKLLQCLSFVEDEIVRSAVRKHRQTKITAFFR
ncbi:hypothetical protein HPB50_023484 [Hyalomma asiaticum]|uniref:Uncharacterized protein n=1 Tax=Hyalomma asiaticum TaxID=266040 RepID=A0ACB7S983_HYAAI|nr:hypothetical protein HPB50_023484 [Hyalomma asiaticum]